MASDAFWTRRFQRGSAIGRTLQLNGESYTIVGILEPTFDAAIITNLHDTGPDVYVPLQIDPASTDRSASLYVGGHVRRSVSLAEAQSRVAAAAADLRSRFPTYIRAGDGATVTPYQTLLRRSDRGPLFVLTGAVGLVLLIACANLANLMLARAVARTRETAVRVALGATRRRIVQQLLLESLLLAGIGGAAGLLVGRTAIRAAIALAGPTIIRVGLTDHGVPIHLRVLIFTSAVTVATVLAFGLIPALIGSRVDPGRRINDADSHRGSGRHHRRLGGLVTACELGMAVVLLTGAALFIRTFANLEQVRTGFETHGVLALQLTRDPMSRGTAALARTIRTGQERLRGIPGVLAATVSCCPPFDNGDNSLRYVIDGRPLDGLYHGMGQWRPVAPAYFETLKIPVLRGRAFTDRDSPDSPGVVIINQAMADKWWPHGDPIGQRLTLGRGIGGIWEEPSREIVGIVSNVRDAALDREPEPANYVPIAQLADGVSSLMDEVTWLVRTHDASESLRLRIEQTIQQASGGMPVTTARPLDTIKPQAAARAGVTDVAHERLRRRRATAGRHRSLRGHGVRRPSTHARDRDSDRDRCGTEGCDADGRPHQPEVFAPGDCRRSCMCRLGQPSPDGLPVRCRAVGSDGAVHRGHHADTHCGPCRVVPSTIRLTHRSGDCTSARIAGQTDHVRRASYLTTITSCCRT